MFFDPARLPFIPRLVDNWRAIRHELDSAEESSFRPWRERHIYDREWSVLLLFDGYQRCSPVRVEENSIAFPATTSILDKIPGLLSAGFSRLGPNTRIKPHRGYDHNVLRVHLGLRVPEHCGIRVRGQTRRWNEGKCLVFDDTFIHEAWNLASVPRTVLLIDIALKSRPSVALSDAVERLRPVEAVQWGLQWLRFVGRTLRL